MVPKLGNDFKCVLSKLSVIFPLALRKENYRNMDKTHAKLFLKFTSKLGVLSIMPKIPEISVGIQMERSVSDSSDRNIRDHLWRWSTYFGWNIPIEICRSILTNQFFTLFRKFGKETKSGKSHSYRLAWFNRKMSLHFPRVFPLISDLSGFFFCYRSFWHNGSTHNVRGQISEHNFGSN